MCVSVAQAREAYRSLLALLPAELTAIDEPEEIATEYLYLHYGQLFIIWGTIERIVEWQPLLRNFSQQKIKAFVEQFRVVYIVPVTSSNVHFGKSCGCVLSAEQ